MSPVFVPAGDLDVPAGFSKTGDTLLLLALGVGLSFFCYCYLSENLLQYIPGSISLFSLVITYTAAIIIGALFARDRELTYAGRLLGLKTLAGNIAHDLRTPLANIHLQAELQESILEKVNNSEVQSDLKENLYRIIQSIELSNQLITMQLHNVQQAKIDTASFSIYSIKKLLSSALLDYPLKESENSLVEVRYDADFSVWIEEIAFKNVIWNLLKNSFEFIKETGKGSISLWLELGKEEDNFNYLHIKDTAKGLYMTNIDKIFDAFYSGRKQGSGLGLAYCKLLMHAAGGDIYCKGKNNESAAASHGEPKARASSPW